MKNKSELFRIIPASEIECIIPLLRILGEEKVSEVILKERVLEMAQQNYECVGVYDNDSLIGCCGLWYQTRHYAGRSVEMDHVIILEDYRNKGIGTKLMDFVYQYAKKRGGAWVELNTYVHNFPSHKFYYNHGFAAKGYHFVKDISKK